MKHRLSCFHALRGTQHTVYRRLSSAVILGLSLITLMAIASPAQAQTVTVSTLAGQAGTSGAVDGTAASFYSPRGVAVDDSGNVYVGDHENHLIRKITPQGVVSTLAGQALTSGAVDGQAASFWYPRGVAVDDSGNVYVGDTENNLIRKITIQSAPAPTTSGVTLALGTVFVGPGANVPKVDITLTNNSGKPIAGLQFSIDLDQASNNIVTLDKTNMTTGNVVDLLDVSMLPSGLEAKTTVVNDTLKVVIFSTTTDTIPSGGNSVIIGKICYTVPALGSGGSAPTAADLLGQAKALNLINDSFLLVSDDAGVKVDNVGLQNGEIQVGIQGDLAGSLIAGDPSPDGLVDVRDIVVLVNEILGSSELPTEGSVGFNIRNAATGDNPEVITVTDAIAIANIILGIQPPSGKAIATGPVGVSLGSLVLMADGSAAIPVLLDGNGVAGLQASFSFDPSLMSVGTPVLADNTDGLMLDSRIENGTLQLIALSLSGQTLTAGQAVLIPVTLTGAGAANLTMTDLVASSVYAQTIPVQLGAIVQPVSGKGTAAPASFSLNAATPNPFNPATTISYEVPQSAHIQLTIYNLLGQEVVRLVDQVQAAGRYQITWNAVNGQGASVASGVYLYRLSSSSGYSDSRRMTLLK